MKVLAPQPKILFLDFDGVLHPTEHGGEIFSCLPHLWDILRACPAVEVVFSTSWREHHPIDEMLDMVASNGGEDLVHRFVGVTPGPLVCREAECLAWLAVNQRHRQWLALDDRGDWFPGGNLYLVNSVTGLTAQDVPKIIEKLK